MSGAPPRALTQRDFDRFAALSGDHNPIHTDPAFARGSALGATVAQAMLLYGLLDAALSRRLAARLARGDLESDAELLGLTLGQSATPPPNGSPSATWTTPST